MQIFNFWELIVARKFVNGLMVVNTAQVTCNDSHAIGIITGWDEFVNIDWQANYQNIFKSLFLFNGRRLLNKAELKEIGFVVFVIGS
ncbi:hypothetical protein [Gillisia limnaea]|uniref:hypothetical protein n=1 Tax=Gillisia limnaea TaxID=195907 RepID=UPI00031A1899|nr:hypothetical protein [Gillisia limnaea]